VPFVRTCGAEPSTYLHPSPSAVAASSLFAGGSGVGSVVGSAVVGSTVVSAVVDPPAVRLVVGSSSIRPVVDSFPLAVPVGPLVIPAVADSPLVGVVVDSPVSRPVDRTLVALPAGCRVGVVAPDPSSDAFDEQPAAKTPPTIVPNTRRHLRLRITLARVVPTRVDSPPTPSSASIVGGFGCQRW
jgi:hypothetical protein